MGNMEGNTELDVANRNTAEAPQLNFGPQLWGRAYIIGCGHAAGSELEGPDILTSNYNLANSYAAQFARQMKFEPINMSTHVASNDYIARNVFELRIESNDLVILCWTNTDRFEFYDDKLLDWVNYSYGSPIDTDSGTTKAHKDLYNGFVKLMCDNRNMRGTINKVKNIIATHAYLKFKFNCRIAHFDSSSTVIDPIYSNAVSSVFDRWVLPNIAFNDWARNAGYAKSNKFHYYGLDAHTDFATLAVNYVRQHFRSPTGARHI